jgi:malate dehydrogenase
VGVPVVLGGAGVERVIEIDLLPAERAALDKSIAAVKDLVAAMNRLTGVG